MKLTLVFAIATFAAVLLLAYALYKLKSVLDDVFKMTVGILSASSDMIKAIDEIKAQVGAVSEVLDISKEAMQIQLETEKKFRDGLQSIIDY